jgi:hypothetical protein
MPETLTTQAQRELDRQMARADATEGGQVDVRVDRQSAQVEVAGDVGAHTTIGAYARYYWDQASAWTAGVWARIRWGG